MIMEPWFFYVGYFMIGFFIGGMYKKITWDKELARREEKSRRLYYDGGRMDSSDLMMMTLGVSVFWPIFVLLLLGQLVMSIRMPKFSMPKWDWEEDKKEKD